MPQKCNLNKDCLQKVKAPHPSDPWPEFIDVGKCAGCSQMHSHYNKKRQSDEYFPVVAVLDHIL